MKCTSEKMSVQREMAMLRHLCNISDVKSC